MSVLGGIDVEAALPHVPNSFVGRDNELGELRTLLRTARLMTLCGAGGIGKTRLAVELLTSAADEFPDGVRFIDLSDLRQADFVILRVAASIGIAEEPDRPLLETLTSALSGRSMLLALDNCEHLIEQSAGLCVHLLEHAPGLRILATSREPLRVAGERVWQVSPLGIAPESVQLFADRAAASASGFVLDHVNASGVAALCRALDGVPLAIELAAARARVLSVDQIRSRLTDRFALLTAGDRTAPARQRTLRAAIEWSHDLLTLAEKVLLRRLSVFAGWSLEMAEQVCADRIIPAESILDLLAALVDKSLVVREPDVLGQARYRMLDTIREYAAAQLAQAGEHAELHRLLAEYTLEVAEHNHAVGMAQIPAPWSARVDIFRRFDVDGANLTQVLGRLLTDGNAELGLRVCTAVRPCWLVRGSYAEGTRWLDAFLALPGDVAVAVRGAALTGRAQLMLSGDPSAAERGATEGLDLSRLAGDDFWIASALNVLSEIALHIGNVTEAADMSAQALLVARAAKDGWNVGYALGTSAAAAGLSGRLRDAEHLATEALEAMRDLDQQWGVARTWLGLGDLARVRGDVAEAGRCYQQALPALREVAARPETARCLSGLARVAIDTGDLPLARERLSESLRISQYTGARIGVARGLATFAALMLAEQRPDLSVRLIAAAAALREAAGLSPVPGAQAERYRSAAGHLGDTAVARLWADGAAMTSDEAVMLALDPPQPGDMPPVPVLSAAAPAPGGLTARERQVVALIASGLGNNAIAVELVISPATTARHVANILAKLGFTSRAQVAAWAAGQRLDTVQPPRSRS